MTTRGLGSGSVRAMAAAVVVAVCGAMAGAAQAATVGGEASELNPRLKAAVVNEEKALGPLAPWQKRIYSDEIVPQFNRFVRDYRATTQGLDVQVDRESLQDYLRFHATLWNRAGATAAVAVGTAPDCRACGARAEGLRALGRARLDRRGFKLQTLAPSGAAPTTWAAFRNSALEAARGQGLSAVLVVWSEQPAPDDPDAPGADEVRYVVRAQLEAVGEDQRQNWPTQSGQLETRDPQALTQQLSRLLTDAFAAWGKPRAASSASAASVAASGGAVPPEAPATLLELRGWTQYGDLVSARAIVGDAFRGVGLLEWRNLERGRAEFALRTGVARSALEPRLAAARDRLAKDLPGVELGERR